MALLLKSIYYEIRAINLYLEGAAFSVNISMYLLFKAYSINLKKYVHLFRLMVKRFSMNPNEACKFNRLKNR